MAFPRTSFSEPLATSQHLTIDAVTTRSKDTNGKVVNQHEKPPELLYQLNRRFGIRGSTVLIIGAGCGGDVVGAIPGPQQCTIALEPDPDQFKCLVRRITNLASPSKTNKDIKWIDGRVSFDVKQEFEVVPPSCLACGQVFEAGKKILFCAQCQGQLHGEVADGVEACAMAIKNHPDVFFCGEHCVEKYEAAVSQEFLSV